MAVHSRATVLLTRPQDASVQFAERLEGIEVVIAPLMEITATGAAVDLDGTAGLIVTSQNALPFVPETALPVFCVGEATAAQARARGLMAVCRGSTADDLVASLVATPPAAPLVHVHGVHVRGDVATRLSASGLPTRGVAVYDQRAVPAPDTFTTALTRPGLILPAFSPRSAKLLAGATPELPEDATPLALSSAVAEAFPPAWQRNAQIAEVPTASAMAALIAKVAERINMRRNSP